MLLHTETGIKTLFGPPHLRVALVAFLFSAAGTAAMIAMPFFVFNQLGRGVVVSGIYSGTQALGYTLFALLSAPFVGRAKNGLRWGVMGVTGFMILIGVMSFSQNIVLCGVFYAGAFSISALAWPSFHSWVGTEPDLQLRACSMGRLNVGWSTGGAAGPFVAGPLYEYDYRFAFAFVILLCLFSLYLILTIPNEKDYFHNKIVETSSEPAAYNQRSEVFLWCAWCATFTAHICVGATRFIYPKILENIIDSGSLRFFMEKEPLYWLNSAAATRFSWLMFICGLGTAVLFLVLGRSTWWHHRFSLLVIAQLLTGISMFVLGFTSSLLLMLVAFSIIGANLGVAFFSSVYYGMANVSLKHRRSSINEGVVGAGGIVGSFGFSFAGAVLGLKMPFLWMPVFMVAVIFFQLQLIRLKEKNHKIA